MHVMCLERREQEVAQLKDQVPGFFIWYTQRGMFLIRSRLAKREHERVVPSSIFFSMRGHDTAGQGSVRARLEKLGGIGVLMRMWICGFVDLCMCV
jgi:hypothetical protein